MRKKIYRDNTGKFIERIKSGAASTRVTTASRAPAENALADADEIATAIRKVEDALDAAHENSRRTGQAGAGSASFVPEVHGSMTISREELDAKLTANQARLEAIELRIEAKLDGAISRLEFNQRDASLRSDANLREFAARVDAQLAHTAKTGPMIASVFIAALSVLGIFLGVVSYASDRFDGGIGLMSSNLADIETLQEKQTATEKAFVAAQKTTHEQYLELSRKLDALVASTPKQ